MSKNLSLVQRVDFIKDVCRGKKVLHLGCTNFPYTAEAIANDMLLHFELREIASDLYGFDADAEGVAILEANGCNKLFVADLENLDEVEIDETFDIIIAGEMIEHLNNPGLFLNGIKRFMSADTELVITTINAYCAMRFLVYFLRGKGGKNEPVHPDHVAYYSYRTLGLTLERMGLEVTQSYFYDVGKEHRRFNRWFYNVFNDVAVWLSPQLSDGVIAVAKLR